MKLNQVVLSFALSAAAVVFAPLSMAQQDSSSNLVSGFNQVAQGTALMVRVPVNAAGQEDAAHADMRVAFNGSVASNDVSTLARAFDSSTAIAPAMFDINGDSSTNRGNGYGYGAGWNYNNWSGNNGWQNSNYFYNYNFNFSYNNYNYNYRTNPYCNTVYSPYYANNYNYSGYRYYYYPRGW